MTSKQREKKIEAILIMTSKIICLGISYENKDNYKSSIFFSNTFLGTSGRQVVARWGNSCCGTWLPAHAFLAIQLRERADLSVHWKLIGLVVMRVPGHTQR